MNIKGLLADTDLDTVDLCEEDAKPFENSEAYRVKLEDGTKIESEIIEIDSSANLAKLMDTSSNEETGVEMTNEYEADIDWGLIEADESDEEEGRNEKLNKSTNELGFNSNKDLNLEGKENNEFNVISSNDSTVENMELELVLYKGEKERGSVKMKDIYAYEVDSDGMVENIHVVEKNGKCEKNKGSIANSEIERACEKTGSELILVSDEGIEPELVLVSDEGIEPELVLVSDEGIEGSKNRELFKTKGRNEEIDLHSPLSSLKAYKKKVRNEKTKDKNKMDLNANVSSALGSPNVGENSSSKRKRKESKYLTSPFISTIKITKMGNLFTGEDRSEFITNGEKRSPKKAKFVETVLSDLISTAQNPCESKQTNPAISSREFLVKFHNSVAQGCIYKNPAALMLKLTPQVTPLSKEDLIAKFTKFGVLIQSETEVSSDKESARVVFAREKDAESAFNSLNGSDGFENTRLRLLSPVMVGAPPPGVLKLKEKLEEMVKSLNGSGLSGGDVDLVGDTKSLLDKVNFVLSKD